MNSITYNGIELAIPDHPRFRTVNNGDCYFSVGFHRSLWHVGHHLEHGPQSLREDMIHCAYFYWMRKADEKRAAAAKGHASNYAIECAQFGVGDEARTNAAAWAKLLEGEKS